MRYISASGMHFKGSNKSIVKSNEKFNSQQFNSSLITRHSSLNNVTRCSLLIILFSACCLLLAAYSHAVMIDRVIAYVDDTAITLSEFKENYEKMEKTMTDIKEEDIVNSLINRQILMNEAKRMKLEAPSDDEILKDYIDIKIGSLIFIKEDDIHKFYIENSAEFNGHDYLAVRDDIEKYLFNLEMNKQLKKHLEGLRADKEIKIHLIGK